MGVLILAAVILGFGGALAIGLWRAGLWGRAALVVLAVALAWSVYRAVEPPPSFYEDLFAREARTPFPASGQFLDRSASYPDNTGDYCAAALVTIDSVDAARLRAVRRLRLGDRSPAVSPGRFGGCGVSLGRRAFSGVTEDSKDGRSIWWGISEDSTTLAFEYVQM